MFARRGSCRKTDEGGTEILNDNAKAENFIKSLTVETIHRIRILCGMSQPIQTSGTGDCWFTTPAPIVDGLYFPGYTLPRFRITCATRNTAHWGVRRAMSSPSRYVEDTIANSIAAAMKPHGGTNRHRSDSQRADAVAGQRRKR